MFGIKSYAKVYVQLQQVDPRIRQQWQQTTGRLMQMVQQFVSTQSRKTELLAKIETISDLLVKVDTTSAPVFPVDQRVKRGLFDFIGNAASSLFGIPSADDINALKKSNQIIADQVEKVVAIQQQVIGRVNKLSQGQNDLYQKMTAAYDAITQHSIALANLEKNVKDSFAYIWCLEQILEVRFAVDQYLELHKELRLVRMACESDSHSEITISADFLKAMLSSNYIGQIDEVLGYYQYIHTDKIIMYEDNLYCVISIPIAADMIEKRYVIQTFPICKEDQCYRVYEDTEIVFNPKTEDLYFPEQCYGYNPPMCQSGVVYDAHTQPCLHGLITHDSKQQEQCPITVTSDSRIPVPVQTGQINRYVVATEAVTYHYRCNRETPKAGHLPEGIFVISIDGECDFDTPKWQLRGKPVRKIFRKKQIPPPLQLM